MNGSSPTRLPFALASAVLFVAVTVYVVTDPSGDSELAATSISQVAFAGGVETIQLEAEQPSPVPARVALREPKSIALSEDQLRKLMTAAPKQPIAFDLPDGATAIGNVTSRKAVPDVPDGGYVQGRLTEPQPGFFFVQRQSMPGIAGDYVGAVRFDDGELAYTVVNSPTGPRLATRHIDDVFCSELPQPEVAAAEAELPDEHPNDVGIPAYQNGVIPLQSLPGAIGVIYLDYDGEEGPFGGWGDFDAVAPSASNAQIRAVWERVAEDFAPFNLNVTTDLNVYLAAPENSRQRCIVTPTNTAASGAGGVAYLGSFNWTGDAPCWAFYATGKNSAEVISHEIGHTLKLGHDGRTEPAETYFGGFDSGTTGWAPIMGNSYSRSITQWSKGEYLNASRTEDDLAVVTSENNNVDFRTDASGSDLASASHLRIAPDDSVDSDGVIETTEDVDAFRFTLTASTEITLNANPIAAGTNLDMLAELRDADGILIASDNPEFDVDATVTATLGAGTYTFQVSGVGRGGVVSDGYSDYASLGFYTITGSVPNAVLPDRFEVAENSPAATAIGTITPRDDHGVAILSYAIASGNENGMFSIDPALGTISVGDASLFNFESWTSGYESPEFELSVTITELPDTGPSETIRVVIALTNVNEPPTADAPIALQVLDSTAPGIYLATIGATDPDFADVLTYAITSGNPDGSFAIDASSGEITVAGVIGADTQLDISVSDDATPPNIDTTTVTIDTIAVSGDYVTGHIRQTFFEAIDGSQLSSLTTSPKFPNHPDSEKLLDQLNTSSHGDSFGSTIRGYLIPPADGDYTFWLASDDQGQLLLSTDADPANTTLLTSVANYTGEMQWNNPSTPVALLAGQAYYIEVRYKEGGGGDHASVAWETSGIAQQAIPGSFLAPYYQNYAPTIADQTFTVSSESFPGEDVGTVVASDVNAGDSISELAIVGGNAGGIFAIDPQTGLITVANYGQLVVDEVHSLTVRATDSAVPVSTNTATIDIGVTAPAAFAPGGIVQEIWDGIGGSDLGSLTSDSRYPHSPSSTRILENFDTGEDISNNYGSRIRAYIIPPTSGDYTFHLCSDDYGQLLLSTDETAANATQIANINGWASRGDWTKYSSQTSVAISLVAGQRYYIEALLKEGGGGDHLEVAWTGPDFTPITIVGGAYLVPFNPYAAPEWTPDRYVFSIDQSAADDDLISTLQASQTQPLLYAILNGNTAGAFALDANTGQLTVADSNALTEGRITLDVGARGYGPVELYAQTISSASVEIVVTSGGNLPPAASAAALEVAADTSTGSVIGNVVATDPNPGDILTCVLNEPSPFSIEESTGQLTLETALDPEIASYALTFTVTDAGGLTHSAPITIDVTAPLDADGDGLQDSWETEHFGDTASLPADDPDDDGLSNFAEMAFGSDPNRAESTPEQITRDAAQSTLTVTYRRPKDFAAKGLSYEIVESANLSDWSGTTPTATQTNDDPDGVTEWVTQTFTPGITGARCFTCVRASQE